MGVAELKDAFNAVTQPESYVCTQAFLGYEHAHDIEWQRLTFSGIAPDGKAWSIRSELLRPGTDVVLAARDTALRFLKDREAQSPQGQQS